MSAAHALIIDDKFLIDSPDFTLPGQIAKGSLGHGLDVLGQRDGSGACISCLGDGGAEEQVAEAC